MKTDDHAHVFRVFATASQVLLEVEAFGRFKRFEAGAELSDAVEPKVANLVAEVVEGDQVPVIGIVDEAQRVHNPGRLLVAARRVVGHFHALLAGHGFREFKP